MNILITGYCGFVGPYAAQTWLDNGQQVFGSTFLDMRERCAIFHGIDARVEWRSCDITDPAACRELIAWSRPDRVIHLAAQSHIPTSIQQPELTRKINVEGTRNLLDAIREVSGDAPPRVLLAGSALQYGTVPPEALPVTEATPLHPENPYAESKNEQERVALDSELPVYFARPFNHFGPGQRTGFVASDFARQIARIKLGKQESVLRVGNLEPWRDFLDVRDVIRAYMDILERGKARTPYNIASNSEIQMRQILEILAECAEVQPKVETDPQLYRETKHLHFRGSYERLHTDTGWRPQIPIRQTLRDVLQFWLNDETDGGR
ncbi:GDP-mannose 4,6-dehydratase [Candidatus Sumerlaeota bacterium]|nr:GDP-mannose 4,6-dehydratase [Candidatus Sumerlaeota bacterium]